MRSARVSAFEFAIRNFVLSTAFREAVLAEKPALATNIRDLSDRLKADFPQPPEITVADLSSTVRRALLLNRKELPLTLVVLDEVQRILRFARAASRSLLHRWSNGFKGANGE